MTYQQAIRYLYQKLPLYSSIGIRAYKADLTNTLALCKFLGQPQEKIRSIHVAGTNGKGSTSHMLAAIFQEHGYKTGLYTSPHLKDFRERIRINGRMIRKRSVARFVETVNAVATQIGPSFFELTFVMALQYFAEEQVDIAIIETGLGGRLDSTNVIMPEVSVITNIGFDHMDILGKTLDRIAFEKAGIIKKKIPAVIGETTEVTRNVFLARARELDAPLFFAEDIYHLHRAQLAKKSLEVTLENCSDGNLRPFKLDLGGLYQQKNLRTVITATDVLKERYSLEENKIRAALRHVKRRTGLHGRWEVIRTRPLVVLDVAHNADGISQVIDQIRRTRYRALHMIFGMVRDKETDPVLALLPREATYYFTRAHIPRALPEQDLSRLAAVFGLQGETYQDVNQALRSALASAAPEDLIVVCGSVFVVGEVNRQVFDAVIQ